MTVTAAAAFVVALSYGCTTTITEGLNPDGGTGNETGPGPDTGKKDQNNNPDVDQGDTSTTPCVPVDVSAFVPPAYTPALHTVGACTAKNITDYDTNCNARPVLAGCTPFETANPNCVKCLYTPDSASKWGPIVGHTSQGIDNINLPGCIELVGNLPCAKAAQTVTDCETAACPSTICPVTDQASLTVYEACAKASASGGCKKYVDAAAACEDDDGGPITSICLSGSGFSAGFLATAGVFCGYADGG